MKPLIHVNLSLSDPQGSLAASLNQAIEDSHGEFVVLNNADLGVESREPSEADFTADCLLVEKSADDWEREVLLRLPRWLAGFVPPFGTPVQLVIRRSAFESTAVGPFREVGLPIHDWMVRGVLQGREVHRDCDSSPLADPAHSGVIRPKLCPVEPAGDADWLRDHVHSLDIADYVDGVASPADGVALKAGILQMHDFLDASHEQSQSVEGKGRNAAGDYWHAIMHRREPDYSNAKYWFRRVGSHPIFPQLTAAAESLLDRFIGIPPQMTKGLLTGGDWDSFAFVDFCQACHQAESDEASQFARQLQWIEMLLLLEQTYRDVIHG